MGDWQDLVVRIVGVEIRAGAAQNAESAPGPAIISRDRHVGVGYQVLTPTGKVVHEGGLTLEGPAGELELPYDLKAAVDSLWEYAKTRVIEHVNLPSV